MQQDSLRIGHGFDVHGFTDGNFIILGGVKIPHHHMFRAHSDGDVLVHAICDALLGATGQGDIGVHFPDTDAAYQNISSFKLLDHVYQMVRKCGYLLGNMDATIIAQAPRLSEHIQPMRSNLAAAFNADEKQINIKATTTEHMGYIGREEGIAAHAVVILYRE